MGGARMGIDHRTGIAWMFNNDNELYMRNLVGGPKDGLGWVHYPTVGTKPKMGCTFTLVEHLDLIVGYTGDAHGQGGDGFAGADPQTTYILDLATLIWRNGPAAAAAVPLPTAVPQTAAALLYDRFNKEVKYVITTGLQVWRLDIAATPI